MIFHKVRNALKHQKPIKTITNIFLEILKDNYRSLTAKSFKMVPFPGKAAVLK